VRRWINRGHATPEAHRLLAWHCEGRLPSACPSWDGWQVRGRWLVDPEGGCYEAKEIRSRWLLWQLVRAQRQERNEPQQLRLF
jgi:hypothetical protein